MLQNFIYGGKNIFGVGVLLLAFGPILKLVVAETSNFSNLLLFEVNVAYEL